MQTFSFILKTKSMNKIRFYLWLMIAICSVAFITSCSDDDSIDKVDTITMEISSETDITFDWGDVECICPMECMKVKIGKGVSNWEPMNFYGIENFEYVKGYEYNLRVQRTTLANPPADGSMYKYKLLEILSCKRVIEYPETPTITDESKIEYEVSCPDHFYDIWNNEITVDNEGNLSHNKQDGSTKWLSYQNAVIFTEYVLPRTDSRWCKNKYMPTKIYVISPFSDEIRIVPRGSSNTYSFKKIIPEEEFNKIKTDIKHGESVSYNFILVNAWQKAIQKVELKIIR